MISVTVVIPNYNGMKYVEGCLNALYQQEEGTPEFQVLVVDNGSSDGSDAVIEDKFPRARLIRLKENTGFCHAVNLGIQEADSPYVILLNNDTKVEPGFVKALFHAICQEENCFSVCAKCWCGTGRSLWTTQGTDTALWAGRTAGGREDLPQTITKEWKFLPPAQAPPFTGNPFWKKLVILTKIILLTWRI